LVAYTTNPNVRLDDSGDSLRAAYIRNLPLLCNISHIDAIVF